jgi:hypothetical protein
MCDEFDPEMEENGEDGWYIVLANNDYHDEPNIGHPVRAQSPEHAIRKRAMEKYEIIRVYQLREKPTGACEYWDESVIE